MMKEQINLAYIHDKNNPINEKQRYYDGEAQKTVQIQRNLGLTSGVSIIVGMLTLNVNPSLPSFIYIDILINIMGVKTRPRGLLGVLHFEVLSQNDSFSWGWNPAGIGWSLSTPTYIYSNCVTFPGSSLYQGSTLLFSS